MKRLRFRVPVRIGLLWLIAWALVLPVAQSVVTWHAYSHAAVGGGIAEADGSAAHTLQCGLCVTGAAVAAGGFAAAPICHSPSQGDLPTIPIAQPLPFGSSPTLAYRSRAPPLAS